MQSRRLIGVVAFAFVGAGVFYAAESYRRSRTGCMLPAPPVGEDAAAQVFAEGMRAVQQKNLSAARLKLSQLMREHRDYARAPLLDRAIQEGEAAERLERAKALLDESRWVDAKHELDKVPDYTLQHDERERLKRRLSEAVAALIAEAESLRGYRDDREKMVRLEELGDLLQELEPHYGTALRAEARVALEDLDMPWAKALERYDEGDVSDALTLAKRCAKANEDCARMAKVFAAVQAQLPKLSKTSTAKVLELYRASVDLSEGEATLKLEDELVLRYEAAARRCRTAGDWLCVDRQLALADDIQVDFEDATIREDLEDWFDREVQRATLDLPKQPARAKATLVRLSGLKSVDFNRATQLLELWKQPKP